MHINSSFLFVTRSRSASSPSSSHSQLLIQATLGTLAAAANFKKVRALYFQIYFQKVRVYCLYTLVYFLCKGTVAQISKSEYE